MAKIVSINISEKKGTVKKPMKEGILIENFGLEGDAHAGDWHRQLSLLAIESYEEMKNAGIEDLPLGAFAENITTEGITLFTLPIGTKLKIGSCLVEVTQIGKKCHQECEIFHRVGKCVMPTQGIFVRVLEGGKISAGDLIEIADG